MVCGDKCGSVLGFKDNVAQHDVEKLKIRKKKPLLPEELWYLVIYGI